MPINNIPITAETEVDTLVTYAISVVPHLSSGEQFTCRELFHGYEWNRLSNGKRAQVGSGFYHQYAKNESISQVEILDKTAQNQQKYRKK